MTTERQDGFWRGIGILALFAADPFSSEDENVPAALGVAPECATRRRGRL